LEEIIEAADGLVIERGYLGMEFRLEDSAFIVKHIINRCNSVNKPVILSTQILETMHNMLKPSRADVCDVSNAVLSGIDCLVLTGE
jgi:pyruvate kinase